MEALWQHWDSIDDCYGGMHMVRFVSSGVVHRAFSAAQARLSSRNCRKVCSGLSYIMFEAELSNSFCVCEGHPWPQDFFLVSILVAKKKRFDLNLVKSPIQRLQTVSSPFLKASSCFLCFKLQKMNLACVPRARSSWAFVRICEALRRAENVPSGCTV